MKILYLSKALVVGAYQTKMELMAAEPDLSLVVLVPPGWRDDRGLTPLNRAHTTGYDLQTVPILFNGSYHFHFYPTIGRLLDRHRPDLFHIDEEPYNLATGHAAWEAKRRRIPFLFFSWQNLYRRYPPPFRWMERWTLGRSAHAIGGNRDAIQVLRRKGYAGPATVLPQFGVDLRHFRPRPASTGGTVTFGYAGRLVEEKGLHLLLDALATLPAGGWRCLLLGSGAERARLEQQAARLGLGAQVEFLPPRPSTEMESFYHQLDVFVLPSLTRSNWKEQFGRVLIEAMASGVAVVGSDSGEIPHVIGEAGRIVPEGNAAALGQVLGTLLAEPDTRSALGRAGRARVEAHFTQQAIAQRTVQLYRTTIRAAGGPDG